ncbi:hypothetical protein [Acinetobacter sp. ASP199]|uniref:hypothetical protein n=1 Tax=unclassified Acinetobacter TaxID=196816 RepID=UPI001F61C038|nr:hypothetical protein [Acinetobacter sp. ASP199]
MKFKVFKAFKTLEYRLGVILLGTLGLMGCERHSGKPISDNELQLSHKEGVAVSLANQALDENTPAKRLTDIAGHATFREEDGFNEQPIPDYAVDFVGRYYTEVSCDDGFSPCKNGKAMFILTLAPNGLVYRSILQHGQVFTFQNKMATPYSTYRKDRWELNPTRKELVIYRKEGLVLYYTVKDNTKLVMNIAKTQEENHHELMDQHYVLPRISYELVKDVNDQLLTSPEIGDGGLKKADQIRDELKQPKYR